jgi:hypothetical protein
MKVGYKLSPPRPSAEGAHPSGSAGRAGGLRLRRDERPLSPVAGSAGPQPVHRPDVKRHLQVAQQFVDAGFDHLVTMNASPDPDGFIDFFASELAAPLRALTPSTAA